jgi:hypothetical protein
MRNPIQVTIDCAEPAKLVRFWAEALGYVVEPPPDGFDSWLGYWRSLGIPADELPDEDEDVNDSIVDPDGVGPRIWFQQVPEPKTVKNRLHFDLKAGGGRTVPLPERRRRVDDEVSRLVALGGAKVRALGGEGVDHYGVVMNDPEGNEFCVA